MELDSKQLNKEALQSAKEHFRGVPRYAISVDQWIRYQQSYKSVYRHEYAKNKLKTI
jgi:hypothetical protein